MDKWNFFRSKSIKKTFQLIEVEKILRPHMKNVFEKKKKVKLPFCRYGTGNFFL